MATNKMQHCFIIFHCFTITKPVFSSNSRNYRRYLTRIAIYILLLISD